MKTVRELAIEAICPNNHEPTTVFEINMVNLLTEFGERVLKEINDEKSV